MVELEFDLDQPDPKFVLFALYHVTLSCSLRTPLVLWVSHQALLLHQGLKSLSAAQTPPGQTPGSHWAERDQCPQDFGGSPAQGRVKCWGSGSDRNEFKSQLCCALSELKPQLRGAVG